MKLFRILGYASFIIALLVIGMIRIAVYTCQTPHTQLDIMKLEFIGNEEGKLLINHWANTNTCHNTTLLSEAVRITRWDFLFIIGYVSVIIILSYQQMEKEPRSGLNNLLRLNFLLAILAGILDVIENIVLLSNMKPWNIGNTFHSVSIIAEIKFALIVWSLLVLLGSAVSAAQSRKKVLTPVYPGRA